VSLEDKSRNHRFLIEHLDQGNLGVKEESRDRLGPVSGSGQTERQALSKQGEKRTRPLAVRFIGYVFFLVVVVAASIALGGGIAVAMEHLELL
jgi:hypothetical protein